MSSPNQCAFKQETRKRETTTQTPGNQKKMFQNWKSFVVEWNGFMKEIEDRKKDRSIYGYLAFSQELYLEQV